MAFLVGLGQWVGSGFMVTQWLLKDRDYEPSLLQEVWRAMESSSALITFNGKCFDVPVLQNRFVLSGLTSPLPIGAHLDLLSSAKSMGKRPEYGQSLKNQSEGLWEYLVIRTFQDMSFRPCTLCMKRRGHFFVGAGHGTQQA